MLDQRVARGQSTSIPFTVGDVLITSPAITGLTATSSDQSVVADASLSIGAGAGGSRTLNIAPISTYGTTTITLTVTAGGGASARTATDTFVVRVVEPPSLVVTTNSDASTDFDALTSLREAIAYARTFAAADVPEVTFAANVRGTITLSGKNIDISRPSAARMIITGPGANALSLNGNAASNIFAIVSGEATVSGLTFTNGDSANRSAGNTGGRREGGAIDSDGGILTVNDCAFTANRSTILGGAIDADGVLRLARCTFTNNVSDDEEGAVYMGSGDGANPSSAVDCTFSGNRAVSFSGALGIYSVGATAVTNCTFSNNSVTGTNGEGGALYISPGSNDTVAITGCTFTGNSAGSEGGAIQADDGQSISLTDCTLSGNSAAQGGGIYHAGVPVTFTRCTISGNSAVAVTGNNTSGQGGGIYASSPSTLTNCTISGNSAVTIGGGIYLGNVGGTTLSLQFTTVTANRCVGATSQGGGIYLGDADTGNIARSIVAGNTAATNSDVRGGTAGFTSGGFNVIGDVGTSTGFFASTASTPDITGTTAAPIDARLAPLADNGGPTLTHALLAGSPALDFATSVGGITTDQRGSPRPAGARADSGAFEVGLPSIDLNGTGAGTSVTTAFTEQTPVAIAPDVALLNIDSATLSGATVSLSVNVDNAVETLSATVTNTSITAVYNAATRTLTLSGRDTLARYAQVLASVTYSYLQNRGYT